MAWPVLKAVKKPKKKEDILFCDHEAFFVKNPYCLLMQVSEKNRALFLLLYTNKKKLNTTFQSIPIFIITHPTRSESY